MQRLFGLLSIVCITFALISFPSPGNAQSTTVPLAAKTIELEDLHKHLPDLDTRTVNIVPTTQQLSLVTSLGAHASWTKWGTVKSLLKVSGDLVTGLGSDPKAAARTWIRNNRALFRLADQSVTNLELLSDIALDDTPAHVVLFRQHFGALPAAQDGMITIGVVNGAVTYVSSSAVGDAAAPVAATLSATQAWTKAALNIGSSVNLSAITNIHAVQGWTTFTVPGFAQLQRARLRAFPVAAGTVRPVYETNVLHVLGGSALAYTSYVDAVTGQVLFRQNRVQEYADDDQNETVAARPQMLSTSFSGTFTPSPAKCGTNGPTVFPAILNRSLSSPLRMCQPTTSS